MMEMPNWSNPTPEMLAGVKLARQCSERGSMNETMFAEWVMDAKASLWYLQAADWAENPPDLLTDEPTREAFKQECKAVTDIVDLGYDPETQRWWSLRKLWPSDADARMGILMLMDLGTMLEKMKDIPIWPKDIPREYAQPGFLMVSAGFFVFISTICGPRWRQQYGAMVKAAEQAKRLKIGGGRRRGR
jgi:hypothetical protein